MNIPDDYFTPGLPQKPGAYWWKKDRKDKGCSLVLIQFDMVRGVHFGTTYLVAGLIEFDHAVLKTGLWCRLVPAREIEKAACEVFDDGPRRVWPEDTFDSWWEDSRAKRVKEGTEP